MGWAITTDETFDASLWRIANEITRSYSLGNAVQDDATNYNKFVEAVSQLFQGRIEPRTLRQMAIHEEDGPSPIKDCYVLQLPGTKFQGYFKLDFATLTGKAILVLRAPPSKEQIKVITDSLSASQNTRRPEGDEHSRRL
jgi:hypothetical protein